MFTFARALKRPFSILCLLSLLAQQSQAAAFSVSNGADSGAGSLRQAVTDSNAAPGVNTISWAAGSGGTITLGSNLPAVNANTTFDVTAATNAVVFTAQSIPLSGALTCSNDTPDLSWTIASTLSGAGSLTKTGSGSLALTGANSYSGGTFISAGTLGINADGALGNAAGALTFNGGTLQTAAAVNSARGVTLNAGGTIDTNGFDSAFSGTISGAGGLTKAGAGTLTLSNAGANTYLGGTTINAGVLSVAADNNLGTGGGLTFGGGTLQTTAGLASARDATLNSGGGTLDTNGNNSTFSGLFSGAGGLTKAGAGTLTLSNAGANTYLGGTTINAGILSVSADNKLGDASGSLTFGGGALRTTTGITSARTVSLTGAGTIDTQNLNSAFSGFIVGGGSLTALGAGVLTFTAANSYSGGTSLNGGTLNINTASGLGSGALTFTGGTLQTASTVTFANAITLNAGVDNIDTLGNNSTLAGLISGTGALTTVSTATLYLTGANTYSGGTVLSSGTLNINSDAALGAAAGALTFNGGVLQAGAADLVLARSMTLTAGGAIDTNGYNTLVSGTLSGAGSLTKAGNGTLTLGAANSYTGGTYINAGTLALGVNNALPTAAGALTVGAGGTFDMAGYTQIVNSYVGPGTLSMKLPVGLPNDSLTVTNNANLTGGTLVIKLAPQVVNEGQLFRAVKYGSVTGTLASIVPPAALSFTPTYNAGDLTLTAHLVPFANSAVDPNQTAIGNSLEALRAAPAGDAATVIGSLYTLDAPQLRSALDQIGPISLASMGSLGLAGSGVQSAAVGQRMAALADGSAPDGFASYTVSGHMDNPGGPLLAYAGNDLGSLDLGAARERPASGSPWGIFASGVGSTGRLIEAHGSSGLQPGYSFNTGGLLGGADYRLNRNLAVGGSASYLHGHASVYAPGSGTVDNNSARYGVYATGYNETARASLYLGGAWDSYSTRRGIQFGNISRVAAASPQGTEFNMDASASYDFRTRAWGTFSPFAGLDYSRLMIGSFTEDGAGALDLSVAPQTAQSLQSSLGMRYSDKLQTDSCTIIPYMSLGWRHELQDQSHPIEAQLASGVGSVFSVATGGFARDGTLFGTGFSMDWGKGLTAKLDYAGDFRSHYQGHSYNATLRYKF